MKCVDIFLGARYVFLAGYFFKVYFQKNISRGKGHISIIVSPGHGDVPDTSSQQTSTLVKILKQTYLKIIFVVVSRQTLMVIFTSMIMVWLHDQFHLDGHFHLHDYLYLRDRGQTAQRTRCQGENPAPRAPASILAYLLFLYSMDWMHFRCCIFILTWIMSAPRYYSISSTWSQFHSRQRGSQAPGQKGMWERMSTCSPEELASPRVLQG